MIRRIVQISLPVWWLLSAALAGCGGAGEANYTILLKTTSGMSHVEKARLIEQSLGKHGWKDVYILVKDDHSQVCWGKYPSIKAAQKNLKKAKAFTNQLGQKPFAVALVLPLPGKDLGPPEWNLAKAPGVYSVLVAVYYDVPEKNYFGRKQSAVELCRVYRQEWNWEAYYHHGPVRSHVTIGSFDESAVATVREGNMVRREYTDPRIHEIIDKVDQFSENGNQRRIYIPVRKEPGSRFAKKELVIVRPFVVRIPGKKGQDVGAEDTGIGDWQSWKAP